MSVMLPYRRTHTVAVGLILVDLPVVIAIAAVGWKYGYAKTWNVVVDFRMQHPWTFLPSLALTVMLVRRWWRQ
jgi:hypothetical protein